MGVHIERKGIVFKKIIPFCFCGGGNLNVTLIIELALSAGIGIITFFLKRTISELDVAKQDIAKIKEDYITKEDFFREQGDTRERLNRIMDILLEIKGERNGQGNS